MDPTIQGRNVLRLPESLRICEDCGEARGRTPEGWPSDCYCTGLECNWCGRRFRRPTTNYFSLSDGTWHHIPHFQFGNCPCKTPPEGYTGRKIRVLGPAEEDDSSQGAPER
jgi:hypothetical protein